jgi:hypothetical protein
MKNSILKKSLAAMAFLVAVCAGTSHATFYNLAAGSFSISTHIDGLCDNPNGYPVVIVQSSALANSNAGFHLDGSESANHWLKTIQDAVINNRSIIVYTNDNWNMALCGRITENGYTGGAYRILAIRVSP